MTTRLRVTSAAARLLPMLASLAAFAAATWALDPEVLRTSRWPRPLGEPERSEVIGTVRDFERYYADFFASGGDPLHVGDIPASTPVKHQLFRDLGFVRESGLVLVQDLATFEPRDAVRTGPTTAEVLVAEEWNYAYQRAADRVPAARLTGMGRGFRYALERVDGGRWVVVAWWPDDSAKPVPIEDFTW